MSFLSPDDHRTQMVRVAGLELQRTRILLDHLQSRIESMEARLDKFDVDIVLVGQACRLREAILMQIALPENAYKWMKDVDAILAEDLGPELWADVEKYAKFWLPQV